MKRGRENKGGELDHTANCLMLLTKVGESKSNPLKESGFRCKTCNREFSSFQALGGHRASHKRLKLMGTDRSYHVDGQLSNISGMKLPRMHPCPICGLEFAVGQALGGHMRKHRASSIHHGLLIRNKHTLPILKKSKKDAHERLSLCLDLNLTPLENDLKLNLRTPVSVLNVPSDDRKFFTR